MADSLARRQEPIKTHVPPAEPPQDEYADLANLIAEVAKDPARLRRVLAVIARLELSPVAAPAPPVPVPTRQPRTLYELEQVLEMERMGRQEPYLPPLAELPEAAEPKAPPDRVETAAEELKTRAEEHQPPRKPVHTPDDRALVMEPQRPPAALEQIHTRPLEPLPPWLDPNARAPLDSRPAAPAHRLGAIWERLLSWARLAAASVLGAATYIGIVQADSK
jgi:hypothetical protein